MVVGASVPSVSTLTVVARSAAFGFTHGVMTSAGIVLGDIVFILITVYGLSMLADVMGSHFSLIRYVGGAYLVWLGARLFVTKPKPGAAPGATDASLVTSFGVGLLITLADQKAILFYLGFLPTFVDLRSVSFADTAVIVAIAGLAVGGPKLAYALIAGRMASIAKRPGTLRTINVAAGLLLVGVGMVVLCGGTFAPNGVAGSSEHPVDSLASPGEGVRWVF